MLEEPVELRDAGRFAPRETVGGVVIGLTGDEDTGTQYHKMARLRGLRAKVRMKFANGTELRLHLDGDQGPGLGAIFAGEKGKIEINRNKIASNPKELIRSPDNPGPNRRLECAYHLENWIECIKSRKPCNADIEIGQRATTLCYLVNIVREVGRVGEKLHWDPGRRALHELRRGQPAARPAPAQGLRTPGNRMNREEDHEPILAHRFLAGFARGIRSPDGRRRSRQRVSAHLRR